MLSRPMLSRPMLSRGLATNVAPATLVTIPFSHYSELARWTLDATKTPYTERASMPGFHILDVMLATRSFKLPTRARAARRS